MVAVTYDASMIRVFNDEGGFTNDPHDPGGATNYGITLTDARLYWKPTATAQDVRDMPKSVAADIYRKHYANPMRYDDLPAGVDYSVLDAAINSGTGRAPQWLARALGLPANRLIGTLIGPATAVNDKVALIQSYWNLRLSFLHALTTWKYFGVGWGRRCAQGEAAAVRMWLSIGAKLPSAAQTKQMQDESKRAKSAAQKTGTGAATAGAGTTIGAPTFDWSHMSSFNKAAVVLAIGFAIIFVVYLIRRVIIHTQRAEAYATA